ncbi:MAG: ZIP family metal transporter [Clostridia bacterium]|nr:ZIP family metal transporter [Clostridia bacterium]
MLDFFIQLPHVWQALIATLFTWGVTAAGAAAVFLFRHPGKALLDGMLGFSAGVMTAASFWSLLAPGIELAASLGMTAWLVAAAGFLAGGAIVICGNCFYSRAGKGLHRRSALLVSAITLHNIPEGMAVGVAFGALAYGLDGATLSAACLLALGIGLQNFPEGSAVALPLLRDGCPRGRAFFFGQLSGIVEPIAGVIGARLVLRARLLLPWMLCFAAGAMICVVCDELIPESRKSGRSMTALCTLFGFALMMVLDVALA